MEPDRPALRKQQDGELCNEGCNLIWFGLQAGVRYPIFRVWSRAGNVY